MRSIKTHLTAALLLCILLPTGLIGGTAYWYMYNVIRESRIGNVGRIADARYEAMHLRLHEDNRRGKAMLDSLIAVCRYSGAGINACVRANLEQFAVVNHAVGLTFHSGIESDLAVGIDAIPLDELNKPFLPGQIATTSTSKVNGASLLSLVAADPASGFSLVTTYPGHKLQDIFVGSPVLGQSGETFLADNQGFFITKPRYPSQQMVTKPISAIPMQRCLRNESSETLDFDYRNVRIIHGFRFVPEIGGGCIMAHIDQAEAFAPLTRLAMGLGVGVFLFTCSAWLIATMIGRGMTKPIIALADMAQALSRGDFTQQVSSTSYQEIAELSQLFNSMAGQLDNTFSRLKASEHELEKKVVELDVHQIELKMQNEELRRAHIALEESRDRYIDLYEFAPVGYLTLTREGLIAEINLTGATLLGVERKKLLNRRFAGLVAPKDSDRWHILFMGEMWQEEGHNFELMLQRSNNSVFHAQLNCLPIGTDNKASKVRITLTDITERKQVEETLRDLSSHLTTAREYERTRIAREIHDELGGFLTAFKMDLSWLNKQLPADLSLCHKKTAVMNRHLDDAIQALRRIMADLRPSILDHLGLLVAIDWKIDEFRQQTGMQCILTVPENNIVMDEKRDIAVFRIMQEALTNIALHSKATKVILDVETGANSLMMKITDNGCGMTKAQMHKSGKYGILGMHERARHFEGEIKIVSNPGKGTTLVLNMPLKSPSFPPLSKGEAES